MRKFFRIEKNYKFEWNDLRCFVTLVNVILIMIYGLSISWFGLAVAVLGIVKDLTTDRKIAVLGIVKDLTTDRKINGLLMHCSNAILNIYFLLMFYNVIG